MQGFNDSILLQKIAITSISSISPLGNAPERILEQYLKEETLISNTTIGETYALASRLPDDLKNQVETFRNSESKYKNLDDSVLYAILASRKAIENAGWKE